MKQQLLKHLIVMFTFLLVTGSVFSQGVTTASMQGTVTDEDGETLPGANVVATHEPSGTRYGAVTNMDGRFNLPNMRVGGPYTVNISFVGFEDRIFDGINLSLGQNYTINTSLSDGVELEAVEISGRQDNVMNSDRTGAAINLSNERINSLPTISRSINDFTRMTPQSNGTSFAGRDNRFNNYTVDGNIYNNNFGLGSDMFAGGNPLSLDVIEEVQVNLAPYDVRQNGFTGGNVNAITKSGTNDFRGSAYVYTRNQNFQGNRIGENELTFDDFSQNIVGAWASGPIIKNKLFFFASVESDVSTRPGQQRLAARPGLSGDNVTRVQATDLDFVRQSMSDLYGYETGGYEGYDFGEDVLRLNFRLDYNLSERSKLALRFNQYSSSNDVFVNASSTSGALIGGFGTRNSINSMQFRNANYTVDQRTTSIVAELNTRLSDNMANSLNIGFTDFEQARGIPGNQNFPMIEVMEGGQYYMTLGNELFSIANEVRNKTFNITNNLSIFKGRHTYTAGLNLEYMTFDNSFNRFFNGVYRYESYSDFVSAVIEQNPSVQPLGFIQGFAFGDDPSSPAVDETAFGQFGLYIQDEWQATRDLKLTFGLRGDIQFYPITLASNPAIEEFTFRDPRDYRPINIDVARLPSARPLMSPRIGFNWDVSGDRTTQLRGGTGIFTGRIPFVWISNQVNNNQILRGFEVFERTDDVNPFIENPRPFNPDVDAYRPEGASPDSPSGDVAGTDPNFRFPQVWRTNVAVDKVLGDGWLVTLEGIYTKDINNVLPMNVNLPPVSGFTSGPDSRAYWTSNRINQPFSQAIYLTNTNRGHYASLMAQVQKSFMNGFDVMAAYTRSVARDPGLTGGSTAGSLWTNNVLFDRNNPEMSFTRFDQPNRIISNVSWTKEYLGWGKTVIGVFYEGGEQGRFSYTSGGNWAGDLDNRIIYVPNDPSEIIFVDRVSAGQVVFSAQQQSDAFFNYIDQDDYLSTRRGQYAERNGAKQPWVHRVDLRVVQDFRVQIGQKSNTLQLSLDILNFGNMLNDEWGVERFVNQPTILDFAGRNAEGMPTYRLNLDRNQLPTETYRPNINVSQVWQAQFGVRYLFN